MSRPDPKCTVKVRYTTPSAVPRDLVPARCGDHWHARHPKPEATP